MILPVASVVTKKTICEFDLLKASIEQYHQCEWVISCDKHAFNKYKNVNNIKCLDLIKTDDCDHNVASDQQKDNWMKVMMTKFDAVESLLEDHGQALFLDCDMIFVNPISEKILAIFENENIDACICQHMTNDWTTEAKHGLYNGGMFHIKNKDFIKQWKILSSQYKERGFYFEQQPLEYVQRNFNSFNLPINYNIGWWRFNRSSTEKRLDLLKIKNNKIYFGNKPAVNFHVHTLREIGYQNFGQFLVDKIVSLMRQSDNDDYKVVLNILESDNAVFGN
jgi:lipopolysaccharide biosynthesis glycosyltransferase